MCVCVCVCVCVSKVRLVKITSRNVEVLYPVVEN